MNTSRLLVCLLAGSYLACAPAAFAAEVDTEGWRRDRDRRDRPRIVLYERPNFGGASLELELDAIVLDLADLRFPNGSRVNDKVSSIEVGRGTQVRIYENDNYRGEFLELTRSVENLNDLARAGGRSWNDAISSLRVAELRHGRPRGRDPSRMPRIIVFSRKDYAGEAFEIFPGETLDNLNRENFESGTDLNEEISSVRVVGSLRLRLYVDPKNRGEYVDITADQADLGALRRSNAKQNWNDKASSLSVEWVGPPRKVELEDDESDKDKGRDGSGKDNRDKDRKNGDESGTF